MSEALDVLIADDDPAMRLLLADALAGVGQVHAVDDGEACLRAIESRGTELVLLDAEMPGLDGFETCRRIKLQGDKAPAVMFVSAHDDIASRMRGYDAGGDDYVCKPVLPAEVLAKVQRQLAARVARRALGEQLDEAVGAVLSSADMVGEVGVVLDFQRQLGSLDTAAKVGAGLLEALGRYGLEGCVSLRVRSGTTMLNARGPCTALEQSLLEHVTSRAASPRIRPFGRNTSFNFDPIVLFVRELPMDRPAGMPAEEAERHGRAIDNVALLLEGAVARLAMIDSQLVMQDLDAARALLSASQEALATLSTQNHGVLVAVRSACDDLQDRLEESFIRLGLLSGQEDHLSDLVRQHSARVLEALRQGEVAEAALRRVVEQLSVATGPAAAAPGR